MRCIWVYGWKLMAPGLQRAERQTRRPRPTGYAPSTGLMRPPSRSLTSYSRDYVPLYGSARVARTCHLMMPHARMPACAHVVTSFGGHELPAHALPGAARRCLEGLWHGAARGAWRCMTSGRATEQVDVMAGPGDPCCMYMPQQVSPPRVCEEGRSRVSSVCMRACRQDVECAGWCKPLSMPRATRRAWDVGSAARGCGAGRGNEHRHARSWLA